MDDDPTTEELRHQQARREEEERTGEHEAVRPEEAATHGRRAEKAAYLRERLAERERSERKKD